MDPAGSVQTSWPMSLPTCTQHIAPQNFNGGFTVPSYNPHLAPPGSRTPVDHGNMYFMNNSSDDSPWSALEMRTSGSNISSTGHLPSSINIRGFLSGPGSESTAPISDSGYQTQLTGSVLSQELSRREQELPKELTQKVASMRVGSVTSEPLNMKRMPSDQRSVSQLSGRSGSRSRQLPCLVSDCPAVLKCRSDLK